MLSTPCFSPLLACSLSSFRWRLPLGDASLLSTMARDERPSAGKGEWWDVTLLLIIYGPNGSLFILALA